MKFWDSSCLVPCLVEEAASREALRLLKEDPDVIVWWASPMECLAALWRKSRSKEITRSSFQFANEQLEKLAGHAHIINPADIVFDRAKRLLAVHPLGAHDALQLAAALVWTRERPSGAYFLCLDAQLRVAAEREGFSLQP